MLGHPQAMHAAAEPLDGRALTWARSAARELGIDLIAGSVVERVEGQEKTSNTSVHIGSDGEIRAVYRKIHMFDVEVDGVTYNESAGEQAGDTPVTSVLANDRRVGMSVCYDLRFPELYQALSAQGSEVISVPAAFTLATTRDHWEVLLRARAIENQSFVIAPNQVGTDGAGRRAGGRSLIVDPWGVVLATAPDTETTIVADLDFDRLADIRRRLPSLQHRRAEVYA